jgi:hypothetical protein
VAADAESESASEPEPVWLRNRRLRLAQIEADNEHGAALERRYGDVAMSRPRFAEMKPTRWRLRRR